MRMAFHHAAALIAAVCSASVTSTAFALDHWQWFVDTNLDGTTNTTAQYGLTTDKFLPADYYGDGAADFAVVRKNDEGDLEWFIDADQDGTTEITHLFGNGGDRVHAADYNNDGFADFAAVRATSDDKWQWFIDTDGDESTNINVVFGQSSDTLVPGDYNGDGRSDLAVVRVSAGKLRWFIDTDRNGTTDYNVVYGNDGDRPFPADYNGDGRTDLAVVRKSADSWVWFVDTNKNGTTDMTATYGHEHDLVLPADYDGDGAADFAVLRREDAHWTWFIDTNHNGVTNDSVVYGLSSDHPVPADYDGDGSTDLGIIRRNWSELVYRIPFANATEVYVSGDVVGHSPLGRIDMSSTGNPDWDYVVAAAQRGTIVAIVETNTATCDDDDEGVTPDPCPNNYIWIRHDNGEYTKYSHIREGSASLFLRSEGDEVEMGDPIGIEDDVGHAGGVHLHFEVAVPFDESDPFTDDGYIQGMNRVPAICGIEGDTFVQYETYTAAQCE